LKLESSRRSLIYRRRHINVSVVMLAQTSSYLLTFAIGYKLAGEGFRFYA